MRKLSKRKIIAASGILAATAVIAVPAAIVYTTKDISTKDQIGKNVESEIENRFLSSINLLPSDQFGTFEEDRIGDHVTELNGLKQNVDKIALEYKTRSKARMPIYGVLNDVLNVSERFDTWADFAKKINATVKAINNSDWSGLEDVLFDFKEAGAQRLLSYSYGIGRDDFVLDKSEDDPTLTVAEKNEIERKKYGLENSFVSFGDIIDKLKKGVDNETKGFFVRTIVAALNMMTGTPILGTGTGKYAVNLTTTTPNNSIVYMAIAIEDKTNAKVYNEVGDIWQNQILKVWNTRYRNIDQFFSPNEQPLGIDGNYNDDSRTDVLDIYDQRAFKNGKDESLSKVFESFLEGDVMLGDEPAYNKVGDGAMRNTDPSIHTPVSVSRTTFHGTTGRYLTNMEFMRSLFGSAFENLDNGQSRKPRTNTMNSFSWDSVLDKYGNTDIKGNASLGAETRTDLDTYFDNAIQNIFKGTNTEVERLVKRYSDPNDEKSELTKSKSRETLYNIITNDPDFQDSYDLLSAAQKAYDTEIEKINRDSFRVGINLNEFNKVLDSFHLNNQWKIKIASLRGKEISADVIKRLVNSFKYQSDGKTLMNHTSDYDVYGDYIYPTSFDWLLGSADTIAITDLGFTKGAKLSQFENQLSVARIFKPKFVVDQSKDTPLISVETDVIGEIHKGGSND